MITITGQEQVGYIVLGAALAMVSGIVTQIVMVKWGDKRTLSALTILLIDVINQMNGIFEELKSTFDKSGVVYAEYLIQLRSSRVTFDRNKEYIIKISDDKLRKDILSYFDKEMLFDTLVSVLNQLKDNHQHSQYAVDRIKSEVNNMVQTGQLGESIKKRLKK